MLSTDITSAVNITRNPDAQWLIRAAAQTGIPARALQAYVAAAGRPTTPLRRAGSAGTPWRPSASSNPRTELTAAEA